MSDTNQRPKSLFKSNEVPPIDLKSVLLKGFLTKEGGNWKSWKRRFFVLTVDGVLSYFEDETLTKPKGSLNCREAEVHPLTDEGDLYFEIATDVFKSEPGRKLKLLAENAEQIFEWVQAIRAVSCLYGDQNPASGSSRTDQVDEDSEPLC
mmetsp:Transcript_11105/g.11527  ORF Transcript_11105/g.11527 Transcript_11105/m.11527 type:complete len:150 (+) Transcript_11105:44-493(+)